MNTVYTYFDADSPLSHNQPDFVRLWERSWRNHGWVPRILTAANARKSKHYVADAPDYDAMSELAFSTTRGGVFCDPHIMNFGFRPPKLKRRFVYWRHGLFYVAYNRTEDWVHGRLHPLRDHSVCTGYLEGPWMEAQLVDFSNHHTTEAVTSCGRVIN